MEDVVALEGNTRLLRERGHTADTTHINFCGFDHLRRFLRQLGTLTLHPHKILRLHRFSLRVVALLGADRVQAREALCLTFDTLAVMTTCFRLATEGISHVLFDHF